MPIKSQYSFNRERLLLTALIAVSFFGFLLWSIEQSSTEEAALLAAWPEARNPAENKMIKINSPKINEIIKSPVIISGQVAIFEGALQVKIKDASGLVLAQKSLAKASQKTSPFRSSLVYKKPTRAKGTIEVFTSSSPGNAETNKLIIPVTFND